MVFSATAIAGLRLASRYTAMSGGNGAAPQPEPRLTGMLRKDCRTGTELRASLQNQPTYRHLLFVSEGIRLRENDDSSVQR